MQKHRLNDGFNWLDRTGPFRLVSADQAAQYDRDGFFVLTDVFDDASIDALVRELDPLEALSTAQAREQEKRNENNGESGGRTITRSNEITFTAHVVMRSALARAFTRLPFFRDLTADLLGPDVRLYWDQIVYKKPGNREDFPWHQDNGYTFIEPQQYLTCWVALSDADETNGCPWVIPGAHRTGTYAHEWTELGFACTKEQPEERVSAPVRKGGMVVFSSLTPHMTGPNLSDHLRKTYIVQFAPDGASAIHIKDGERVRVPCTAVGRQYPILLNGQVVGS